MSPAPNRWSTPVSPRPDKDGNRSQLVSSSEEKPPTPPPRPSLAHLQLPTLAELGLEPDNKCDSGMFDEDTHPRVSVWTPQDEDDDTAENNVPFAFASSPCNKKVKDKASKGARFGRRRRSSG